MVQSSRSSPSLLAARGRREPRAAHARRGRHLDRLASSRSFASAPRSRTAVNRRSGATVLFHDLRHPRGRGAAHGSPRAPRVASQLSIRYKTRMPAREAGDLASTPACRRELEAQPRPAMAAARCRRSSQFERHRCASRTDAPVARCSQQVDRPLRSERPGRSPDQHGSRRGHRAPVQGAGRPSSAASGRTRSTRSELPASQPARIRSARPSTGSARAAAELGAGRTGSGTATAGRPDRKSGTARRRQMKPSRSRRPAFDESPFVSSFPTMLSRAGPASSSRPRVFKPSDQRNCTRVEAGSSSAVDVSRALDGLDHPRDIEVEELGPQRAAHHRGT